jgi:hypothetical protein
MAQPGSQASLAYRKKNYENECSLFQKREFMLYYEDRFRSIFEIDPIR